MPLGAQRTTSTLAGKVSCTASRCPRRKPCERPSVELGLSTLKTFLYSSTHAASEMSSSVKSDSLITLYISPSVPFASVKPASRASFIDDEPSRRPTLTVMPEPSSDSRKFCACAGPCEPQPITPICFTPASAAGSLGKRLRPPRTICSVWSANVASSTAKNFEVNFFCGCSGIAASRRAPMAAVGTRRAVRERAVNILGDGA
mmetsp:Transcript_710/g.1857  ORF Transcript_710/g.1857 Transcript_710/m.1857 type:complete len:203 (+) Transcript_710:1119-1727(+)